MRTVTWLHHNYFILKIYVIRTSLVFSNYVDKSNFNEDVYQS